MASSSSSSILSQLPLSNLPEGYPLISITQPDICFALEDPYWYSEHYILMLLFSLPILFFINAPYGKLKSSTWTVDISPRLSWFIMESPAWIIHTFLSFIMLPSIIKNLNLAYAQYSLPLPLKPSISSNITTMIPPQINLYIVITLVSALMYNCHYFYRSVIYPAKTRSVKNNDLFPVLLAAIFNIANGIVQAVGMYCTSPKDITGLDFTLYVIGHLGFMLSWIGCYWSDMHLVSLRDKSHHGPKGITTNDDTIGFDKEKTQLKKEEKKFIKKGKNDQEKRTEKKQNNFKSHYTIPRRGLFHYTYSANYLCEFLQWVFFAIMVPYSKERWLFVALTFCNLFPRAYQYRQFYLELEKEQEIFGSKSDFSTFKEGKKGD